MNFLAEEGEQRVHEAYPPATYARLAALKNRYDPTNFFHMNQNIKPTVYPKKARALVSHQHPFGVNAGRRSEKVTQDKASGTPRPTFKTQPLYFYP